MLSQVLRELILPPGGLIMLLTLGLCLRQRAPRVSSVLLVSATAIFYLLSTSFVSFALTDLTYKESVLGLEAMKAFKPQAIVILGGGAEVGSPEYDGLTVPGEPTLRRVEYGAYLAKRTGLPILVTGGFGRSVEESEAWAMKFDLELYGLKPRWLESAGENTRENATLSQAILMKDKIERVLLVTSASHAHRAKGSFEKTGLKVLAAPTGFRTRGSGDAGFTILMPTIRNFSLSVEALRALASEVWYAARR